MTHDLLKNMVLSFNSDVEQIVINDLNEGTFFAKIHCKRQDEHIELDARPSDAIALAIRFSAPIYVDTKVLNEAGIVTEETQQEEAGSSSQKSATEKKGLSRVEELEKELQTAVDTENYEKAAKIRDQIQKLKG